MRTILNEQFGFSEYCDEWECEECGHVNEISSDTVYDSESEWEDAESVANAVGAATAIASVLGLAAALFSHRRHDGTSDKEKAGASGRPGRPGTPASPFSASDSTAKGRDSFNVFGCMGALLAIALILALVLLPLAYLFHFLSGMLF